MKHFLPLLMLTGLLFGQDKDKPKTVISKTISKFNVEEKFGEYAYTPVSVVKVNYNNDGLVMDSSYYDTHGQLVNRGNTGAFYLGWDNYSFKVSKYKFESPESSSSSSTAIAFRSAIPVMVGESAPARIPCLLV